MVIAALFVLMVALLAAGVQIWIAIGLAALLPMLLFGLAPLELLPQMMMSSLDSWTLLAVPFFILAGTIISESSIGQRLVDFFNAVFGRLPGGLAVSAVFTCVVFGGITGSASAESAAVASVMSKPMQRSGYPSPFVASLIAAGGTLANLIPPSIALLIYGIVAKVSVSDLFIAGIIPGLLNAILLAAFAGVLAEKKGYGRAARIHARPVAIAAMRSIWALLAPLIIIGGIRFGFFTPTELAIFVTLYAFVVAKYIYRDIEWRDLPRIIEKSAVVSVAVIIIVTTAAALSWLIETQGLAHIVTQFLSEQHLSRASIILMMAVVLVVAGTVLEPAPLLLIVVPLLIPAARSIDMNMVQFGVFVTVGVNLGLIHPPVGISLFVSAKVVGAPLAQTFVSCLWWLPIFILLLLLVGFVPQLSLALL